MNAQQAPSPRQARPLSACQTASITAHRTNGGIVITSSHAAAKVSNVLPMPSNRLARSQDMTPAEGVGGRSAGSGNSCAVSVIL